MTYIMTKPITEMNGKEIAEWLHDRYEMFSAMEGWDTQELTKVPFNDLPDANKRVMIMMGIALAQHIGASFAEYKLKVKQ